MEHNSGLNLYQKRTQQFITDYIIDICMYNYMKIDNSI